MQLSTDYQYHICAVVNGKWTHLLMLFKTNHLGIGLGAGTDSGTGINLEKRLSIPHWLHIVNQQGVLEMLTSQYSHFKISLCVPCCTTEKALRPKIKAT